jgi:hypothetical protein
MAPNQFQLKLAQVERTSRMSGTDREVHELNVEELEERIAPARKPPLR